MTESEEILDRYLMTLDIDLDGAKANLDGWDMKVAVRAGEKVAICITRGTEIHFVQISEKICLSRKNIREFLKPIFDEWGFATTRVPIAETNHRLRRKLGFVKTWSDENFTYWGITSMPYEK